MTNGSSHIDGEGEAATPMAASPLRSGRRLGCFSWVSEKFPVKDDGCANVSGSGFFLRVEHTEMNLIAGRRQYSGCPVPAAGVKICALYPSVFPGMRKAIVGVVAKARRPEIAWSVIRRIAVSVIENTWDFVKSHLLMKGKYDAVSRVPDTTNLNPDIPPAGNVPSLGPCVSGVPPLRRVLIPEMILASEFPTQDARCFVELKQF